jgi:hypothetical protein
LTLLEWAAALGAISAQALAVHDASSVASARTRLAAAARAGLLARSAPLRGGAPLYTLTGAGLRACGERGLAPVRVTAASAAHAATCALVAARLERRYPGRRVVGEPAIRVEEPSAGGSLSCLLPAGAGSAGARTHRPDLALLGGATGERPVAVEVELTVKAPRRLRAICLGWARCPSVAGVVYLATPPAQRALARAVEATMAADRVVVVPLQALEDRTR